MIGPHGRALWKIVRLVAAQDEALGLDVGMKDMGLAW